MPVPKYYEMQRPFLEALKDGKPHSMKDIVDFIIGYFHLSTEDIAEMLPSGRQSVVRNRAGWASTYLKKAGLVESPARAVFKITERGAEALRSGPEVIDDKYLMQFKSFREFINVPAEEGSAKQAGKTRGEADARESRTPDEILETAFNELYSQLAGDILHEVAKLTPSAFEQMAIDLLHKMGYGAFENAGRVTSASHDDGIDGIIMEDRLGFSLIYIQAKKWDADSTVGQPELQKFVGAIAGRGGKGLFVTTAKFSQKAVEYANRQHIILIDGAKLARLMIEHNFGVRVKRVFEIKDIDTDTFNDYSDD
ncbi:MAG TPA: restriction endonuclease [Candidatus Caccocola faecipullorum]|nr:restriction endonuclease [Candidatus Caccocola faecipullorum]